VEAVSESRWEQPSAPGAAVVRQREVAAEPQVLVSVSDAAEVLQREAAAVEAGSRGPAAPRAAERVVVSGAEAAPQQAVAAAAESVAVVQPREVAAAELDAAAVPQQEAGVAELGAAAELRPVAVAAEWDAEEPRPVVRAVPVASPPAAGPSAAPWVFRRGRPLPWPARRRAARSAHAMRISRAASPSERSWQAARGEALS
jgi:hypothetical protein